MALKLVASRVLSLAGATAASQAIIIMTLPLITRIYSAEVVGVLATALSTMTMLSVVACMRYDQAIPLSSSRQGAAALVWLSFALALMTMTGAGLGLHLATLLSEAAARAIPYPWFIAIGAVLLSCINIFGMWATRERMINTLAVSRVVLSLSDSGLKIGLGSIAATGLVLLLAHISGILFGIGALLLLIVTRGALPLIRWRMFLIRISDAAGRYRQFFRLGLFETILTTIGMQAPIVLIAALFGTEHAALLFISLQIMRGPITLISNAVGRVYLAELSTARKAGTLAALTRDHLLIQTRIGMPIVIFLGLAGSALAEWIFGSQYIGLSVYLIWMIPWMLMVMLVTPFTAVLYDQGYFKTALLLAAVGAVLRLSSIFVSAAVQIDPIILLTIAGIATYLCYFFVLSRLTGLGVVGWLTTLNDGILRLLLAGVLGGLVWMIEASWI